MSGSTSPSRASTPAARRPISHEPGWGAIGAPPRGVRGSVGEVCRTLGAVAWATVKCRDGAPALADMAGSPTDPPPLARRTEVARLRAEARAAVTGLVLRLRADGASAERALVIVRAAARDSLPRSLTTIEARALGADAVRWAAEAYDAPGD